MKKAGRRHCTSAQSIFSNQPFTPPWIPYILPIFGIFARMSPALHNIQPNWTEVGPAPPKLPTLRLLWCSDILLLALYAAHSRRFWGLGLSFLSEGYFTAFSSARHHSLLWKWRPCHIITQGSHKLTVLQTGQVGEIMHGNTPIGGTFHPLQRLSEQGKWNFFTH